MIELTLRSVVALLFLLAATLLPLMIGLTGDPELAAVATAVGTPLAALLLAGAMVEHHRWRADRLALRNWSRLEHPARARRHPLAAPVATAAANPLVDPVDEHARPALALVRPLRIGLHDADGRAAATTALKVVS